MNKFYVTTAIPYVNDKPHIGHAMDYTIADALARYNKSQGKEVFLQVGTDEHGKKIAEKAKEQGLQPKEFADKIVPQWYSFLKTLGVDFTKFVRTTDPVHERVASKIWEQLKEFIYKSSYEGWYCVGCESFVSPGEATENNGVCPIHQKPYEKLSEENYFFKLSAFGEQIKQAFAAGEIKVVPEFRQKEILNLVEKGLEDISITRPKQHLAWGVPVPDDSDHVMYVWFEALMNYISVLGYPEGKEYKEFWPANVQVIGKDILRFHAAIWPAMLIALNIPLPKIVLVHGHVMSNGTKMSKSLGNVVDPMELIETYGVDAFRYFFLKHIPTQDDGDYTGDKFENAYNNELGNELGNLVQRVCSMIGRYQNGVIGDLPVPGHDAQAVRNEIENYRLDRALDQIWMMVRQMNSYLEEVKPWEIAKKGDAEHLQEVLAYAAGGLRQIASLLWPFMPQVSETIEKIFEGEVIKPFDGVLFPKIYKYTPDPRGPQSAPTPSN